MSKKSSYYTGALRITRDGIPCKVAPWVKDLSPLSRDALFRGEDWLDNKCGLSAPAREELAKTRRAHYAIAAE